ncbi:unnamed protein product [Clonostachys rosea f. rosea IK726]|uniref:Uncharacterized protein n=2 Tax=Bionectria ochroleuca TaxID=29856 RepID=A0A0B7K2H2_BIOOC|nr:unnamed protein product [Clonostachys rosea f. rosea IK726]
MSKFPAGSLQSPWIYSRERVNVNVAMAWSMEIFCKIMESRRRIAHAALLVAEFCVTITALALCLWGYPDRFRSRLWENGGAQGWNSDPKQRIYYYANYEEPPEVPLIWSQRLTNSQLCIAALSFVIFIIRAGMQQLGYLPRAASIVYDILLSSLWIWVLVGQNSADYSDSKHPSPHPWYLERSCGESWSSTRLACHVARANFVISILAATIYTGRLTLEAATETWERWGWNKDKGWQVLVNGEPYADDEEMDIIDEEEQTRQIYEAALSPVLAFFPESVR